MSNYILFMSFLILSSSFSISLNEVFNFIYNIGKEADLFYSFIHKKLF